MLAIVLPFFMAAMIGILAAIAIPQFAAYRQKAYNATAGSDLRNCKTEAEAYYADHSSYPTAEGQMHCGAGEGVALYYVSLGPEGYQIISFHDGGDKAFYNHSGDPEIVEYAKEEMEGQIGENFGAAVLSSSFHFIE